MADGYRCKHCGWQETNHKFDDPYIDREEIFRKKKEYSVSLTNCSGFTLSTRDQQLEEESVLSDMDFSALENRSNASKAWEHFNAIMTHQGIKPKRAFRPSTLFSTLSPDHNQNQTMNEVKQSEVLGSIPYSSVFFILKNRIKRRLVWNLVPRI